MIKTEYGTFDGDSWENLCQICFEQNFASEGYQKVKATPGDFGIEGFTRLSGKAFQCYCPDEHYSTEKLYEKQRDKITRDLKKLRYYESQLKKFLGDRKISKWYFVTPIYAKNNIIEHCTKKRDEVISWGLSIIDNENFEVIFEDIDFLHPHINLVVGKSISRINIGINSTVDNKEKLKWKKSENVLIERANRKHSHRLPKDVSNKDKRIDTLTENSISEFLDGEMILRKWQDKYQNDYEKFLKIVSLVENEVTEKCLIPSDNNDKLYWSFKTLLEQKLTEAFPNLETQMILRLTKRVMADWIFRCPIDFE